jgi:hypothetical protein
MKKYDELFKLEKENRERYKYVVSNLNGEDLDYKILLQYIENSDWQSKEDPKELIKKIDPASMEYETLVKFFYSKDKDVRDFVTNILLDYFPDFFSYESLLNLISTFPKSQRLLIDRFPEKLTVTELLSFLTYCYCDVRKDVFRLLNGIEKKQLNFNNLGKYIESRIDYDKSFMGRSLEGAQMLFLKHYGDDLSIDELLGGHYIYGGSEVEEQFIFVLHRKDVKKLDYRDLLDRMINNKSGSLREYIYILLRKIDPEEISYKYLLSLPESYVGEQGIQLLMGKIPKEKLDPNKLLKMRKSWFTSYNKKRIDLLLLKHSKENLGDESLTPWPNSVDDVIVLIQKYPERLSYKRLLEYYKYGSKEVKIFIKPMLEKKEKDFKKRDEEILKSFKP